MGAVLICGCGRRQTVKNPFEGLRDHARVRMLRDAVAVTGRLGYAVLDRPRGCGQRECPGGQVNVAFIDASQHHDPGDRYHVMSVAAAPAVRGVALSALALHPVRNDGLRVEVQVFPAQYPVDIIWTVSDREGLWDLASATAQVADRDALAAFIANHGRRGLALLEDVSRADIALSDAIDAVAASLR